MTLLMSSQQQQSLYATTYDRIQCDIGFVHIGYGAFHRAHQAVYIDDYMQKTGDLRWGIAAVNLRSAEADSFKQSRSADGVYLLKTITPDSVQKMRLVRSHVCFKDWSEDAENAEQLIAKNTVHTITITVTESGYYLNDDFTLNQHDPVITDELEGYKATSIYAFLLAGLKQRFLSNGYPINILCCDNIRSNGKMLEQNFKQYLKLKGEHELLNWVNDHISFPCSMVDRITPRADDALRKEIGDLFGAINYDPVHGEAFTQWVVEQNFKAPIPDLTQVEVQFVDDVAPYEETKIRILNGGHTGLCYIGALAGHTTYDQAFLDPKLRIFFDNYQKNEVLPGLNIDLPFDKHAYLKVITARFSNKAIADQLERICMDGFSKVPVFIRPTIESCLSQAIIPVYGYQCVASWYIFARHVAYGQMPITYHEPYWEQLKPLLAKGAEDNFTQSKRLWADLSKRFPEFTSGLKNAINEMEKQWPV